MRAWHYSPETSVAFILTIGQTRSHTWCVCVWFFFRLGEQDEKETSLVKSVGSAVERRAGI